MNRSLFISLLLLLPALADPCTVWALAKSRYVTLQYSSKANLLRDFNSGITFSRKLRYSLEKKNTVTVEDEVLAKLDIIFEKAETVLDMFPANMHLTVVLLPSRNEVAATYKKKYGKNVNNIAYYSLKEDTIYISVNDASLRVVAHEIGHAIVDHYFQVRPPYTIHELMAQFTEQHIDD